MTSSVNSFACPNLIHPKKNGDFYLICRFIVDTTDQLNDLYSKLVTEAAYGAINGMFNDFICVYRFIRVNSKLNESVQKSIEISNLIQICHTNLLLIRESLGRHQVDAIDIENEIGNLNRVKAQPENSKQL